METLKTYLLQRKDPDGPGEWTNTGIAGDALDYVRPMLKSCSERSPQSEFRIVERTVITLHKTVKI